MKTNSINEKQIRKLNSKLLFHLEKALQIMTQTKCPYFIFDGYGSIYMDAKYIKRNDLNFTDEEINKIKILNPKEKSEFVDKRIELMAKELEKLCELVSNNKNKNNQSINNKPLKIGKTLNDLLGEEPKQNTDIQLVKEREFIEVVPNITKDQAIEQVIKGQKVKDWGMITNINKYKAKSKIGETYDTEEEK